MKLDPASTAYLQALNDGDLTRAEELRNVLTTADTLDHAHRNHPDRLLQAALDYAHNGIPVFPIQPRGKRPLTSHGFKDATLTLDQICAWWTATPDANIGLPTGGEFDVIDVDGATGIATMYTGPTPLIDTVGDILGVALTSRDAGRHIYIPATGLGNKTAIHPGVDYRGAGGYVVAPPSIGANGTRYTWLIPALGRVA